MAERWVCVGCLRSIATQSQRCVKCGAALETLDDAATRTKLSERFEDAMRDEDARVNRRLGKPSAGVALLYAIGCLVLFSVDNGWAVHDNEQRLSILGFVVFTAAVLGWVVWRLARRVYIARYPTSPSAVLRDRRRGARGTAASRVDPKVADVLDTMRWFGA